MISETEIAMLLVISIFALFGVLDDLINIPWMPKVILPLFFSFPLVFYLNNPYITVPFYGEVFLDTGSILGTTYFGLMRILVVPVYIMVVSNLINMHSGFNGLQSGLSCIIIFSIIIKCLIDDDTDNLIVGFSFLGGIFALWLFNKYPARVFEGNIGSLTFGASIGSLIVIKDLYFFGFFILIPHTIDFLLWLYGYFAVNQRSWSKYGKLNDDNTIFSPTTYKLKFILPYYFSLREEQVVFQLHIFTGVFCLVGILLF